MALFGQLFRNARRFAQTATSPSQLRRFGQTARTFAHTAGTILDGASRFGHGLADIGGKALNFVDSVPILGEAASGITGQARGVLRIADRLANTAGAAARAERALEAGNTQAAAQAGREALGSIVSAAQRRQAAGSTKGFLTSEFERQ
jgi:hypothetical protein